MYVCGYSVYVVPGSILCCDSCSSQATTTMFLEHTTLLYMYVCMYVCVYVCMYVCDTWCDEVVDFPDLGVGHVQQDVDGVFLLLDRDLVAAYLFTHTYIHTYIHTLVDNRLNLKSCRYSICETHTYIHKYINAIIHAETTDEQPTTL